MNDYINEAPALLKDFLGYMQTVKGKSPATVDEYYSDLRTFFRYLKKMRKLVPGDMDLQEISISDIDFGFYQKYYLDGYLYLYGLCHARARK